jgi:hypothetical protein
MQHASLQHGDPPQSAEAKLANPVGLATQHLVQLCVLPWVGWAVLGLTLMSWPSLLAPGHKRECRADPNKAQQ